uniref:Uncharacterized protein n=1 Tax=Parascaris univalens TaxID=6257 RepID=A0A915C6I6_PARUN
MKKQISILKFSMNKTLRQTIERNMKAKQNLHSP